MSPCPESEDPTRCAQVEAIVLVGGKGTRLQGVVSDRPKPMAPVAGRPFLEWLLLAVRRQGARRAILATGYMGNVVEAHFGDGRRWHMDIVYSREPSPLGTGGAARLALSHVRSERVLVLNGDSYCPFELKRLERTHENRGAAATLWLAPAADCRRYGSVAVDNDVITAFHEKPVTACAGLINAGIYLFERSVLGAIPEDKPVSLECDVLPTLIGRLAAVMGNEPLLDIGTPESYESAEQAVDWRALAGSGEG